MPANIKLRALLAVCPNAQLDKALSNILTNTNVSAKYSGSAPCIIVKRSPSKHFLIS